MKKDFHNIKVILLLGFTMTILSACTDFLISFGVSSPQLAARFALCGWFFDTP